MLQRTLRPVLLALPAVLLAAGLRAQAVRVTVTDAGTGAPVPGALVRVENEAGELVRAAFSDARGTARL
ncbi:MAG TPA: carboxypeptidase-like regulatory domain-containing protein, partial [Longimicrobium sp.]